MKALDKQYGCPVEITLEVIGGKWKCVILWWLRRGAKRFNELMQLIPGMTRKVLTQQLRELEADGIVQRDAYRESPPRVEYSLAARGETLKPLVNLMCEWGKSQLPGFQFGLLKLTGIHILVIAKEPALRELLRSELAETREAQVSFALAETAVAHLRQIKPDIIVAAVDDSHSAWNVLTEQVQQLQAELEKPIPTVGLIAEPENRSYAFAQGFRLLLTAPLEPAELVAAIASLTGHLT